MSHFKESLAAYLILTAIFGFPFAIAWQQSGTSYSISSLMLFGVFLITVAAISSTRQLRNVEIQKVETGKQLVKESNRSAFLKKKDDLASRAADIYSALYGARIKKHLHVPSIAHLRLMHHRDFEFFIAKVFARQGFDVEVTSAVADGGKDIVMFKDGRKIVVECKRYGTNSTVGLPAMREFWAVVNDEDASEGWFVNTGRYSIEAFEYAQKKGRIRLIDQNDLAEILREDSFRIINGDVFSELKPIDVERSLLDTSVPCPICGKKAKTEAGKDFEHCNVRHWSRGDLNQHAFERFVETLRVSTDNGFQSIDEESRDLRYEQRRYWAMRKSPRYYVR